MSGKRELRRVAAWLLWLYPRGWRLRYRVEMLEALSQHPISLWTLADLLLGAADARLNPSLIPVIPAEVFTMTRRIRTSASAILLALALFVITWVMIPFVGDARATWLAATTPHPEIGLALFIFKLAGAVALLTLFAGGAPLLLATIRQALRERRGDLGWRLAAPLALAAIVVAYSWFTVPNWWMRRPIGPQDLTPTATALRLSFFVLFFVCGVLSAWAVASAVGRAQPGDGVTRFTIIPSVIIAVAMAAALIALVALTALVFAYAPQLAGPIYLMPAMDALTLCASLIVGASVIRMAQPDGHEETA